MIDKIRDKSADAMFEAILTLKNVDECYTFFEDLCTVKEIKSISQRFAVAQMLSEKRVYNEIVEKTGASTATISRVNKCLNYGTGGYKEALDKLPEREAE